MSTALDRMLDAPFARIAVDILDARGSTPREAGAWMLVGEEGAAGTIGGGQLEYLAIDRARAMLRRSEDEAVVEVPLGPEIGQCCGGFVRLGLRRVDAELAAALRERLARDVARRPQVLVFGAGHVGLALAASLALMPVRPILIDTRREAFTGVTEGVETRLLAMPEAILAGTPGGSAVVVMTHDHALDFLIASTALSARRFAYVGMIGSRTKKASFQRWFLANEGARPDLGALVCPIGGAQVPDKRPAVIAALVAAELAACLFAGEDRATAHRREGAPDRAQVVARA